MNERQRFRRGGFTMAELMIVMTIIVILTTILIPVVSKVRKAAWVAGAQNQMNVLVSQAEAYHGTFGSYPGPIPDDLINVSKNATSQTWPASIAGPGYNITQFKVDNSTTNTASFDIATFDNTKITQAENFVLGLLGGLKLTVAGAGTYNLVYDPSLVGTGPLSLNPNSPKKYPALGENKNLSWRDGPNKRTGQFADDAGAAADTIIPEFVDPFPNPMPILVLRARKGVELPSTASAEPVNVISDVGHPTNQEPLQQYQLKDIIAYTAPDPNTKHYIGMGRSAKIKDAAKLPPGVVQTGGEIPHGLQTVLSPISGAAGNTSSLDEGVANRKYYFPYDAYAYFEDPSNRYDGSTNPKKPGLPRAKDRFILICAGADRTYGTADDICSFGAVFP
jgi:prepilin-type N-terminal cleavage/methylation domain-containing protein